MASHALLIGVSEFADGRLARLNAPINDVIALRDILEDASRGGFDSIALSLNEDFIEVRDRVSRFFSNRTPDDLLFLYYSGHGILGRGNRLFLATAGSNLDAPRERSIAAQEIREFIDESRAQRQVVVLDCCHSGAFAEHGKAAAPPPAVTPDTFASGDCGLYVLTAADALQFAWDGAELRSGDEGAGRISPFTSWLIDGLQKGEAAPQDDQITMDAIYRYLFRRARTAGSAATPQRFVRGGVGDLVISRNPLAGGAQIDAATAAALSAEDWRLRLGAVAELTQYLRAPGGSARAARLLLQRRLEQERDFAVRTAITAAIESVDAAAKPADVYDQTSANPLAAMPSAPELTAPPAPITPASQRTMPRWLTRTAIACSLVAAATLWLVVVVMLGTGNNTVRPDRIDPAPANSKLLDPSPLNYKDPAPLNSKAPAPSKLAK
jgi:uncharacterized caspase-like protein